MKGNLLEGERERDRERNESATGEKEENEYRHADSHTMCKEGVASERLQWGNKQDVHPHRVLNDSSVLQIETDCFK